MTTDTSERGVERLICTALTGSPCLRVEVLAEAGDPGTAWADSVHERPTAYGSGWICGAPEDCGGRCSSIDVLCHGIKHGPHHPTDDIPKRVAADAAFQNAKRNSDRQNARIEHDKALTRVMTDVLKDDTELFKEFMDNESFRRWMTDTVFGLTYEQPGAGGLASR